LATVTFTFLFTDIEGSTALLQRLGDDVYSRALADHHAVIRSGIAGHGGREIDTQGDAFFAVFSSPSACVAAVIDMQRCLAGHEWPMGEQVRVRMGIHVGEALETATGLVGFDVHRGSRVAAAAHGGQVLLSAAAAAIVRDSLPAGAFLRDLGAHRLKDLGRPEQIFQLEADGLGCVFPPLRSLENPELANNLPSYLSSFVGRQTELDELRSLVESYRLVTVTGFGGTGKTRLALQVAAELVGDGGRGVWFVGLSMVARPEQVPGGIRAALGVREQAGQAPLDTVLKVLREQSALIILDNCEHLIEACANVADVITRTCPRVHIVATSREPLGIDGERVYRLGPLSLPEEVADNRRDMEGSDAVQLFAERARAHDTTFVLDDAAAALIAAICRRLDGIPLAIEMAAARVGAMSLADLNGRLDQRFRLLTGGSRNAPARQRTLQAMVEWSFDLLKPDEREVLCRLWVFAGGFGLQAAEAVCTPLACGTGDVADVLASLVSKSLVVADRSSGSLRYRLLDTIRQYASSQLVSTSGGAEAASARKAHAEYYLKLAEEAAPELVGRNQGRWLRRLDIDQDNLATAVTYFAASRGDSEQVLRFGAALHRYLWSRGHLEPIAHLRAALNRPEPMSDAVRVRAALAAGYLVASLLGMHRQAEMRSAAELSEQALEMARRLRDPRLVAQALTLRYMTAGFLGEPGAAGLGQKALEAARSTGDPRLVGDALYPLAYLMPASGDRREVLLEALGNHRQVGDLFYICSELAELASDALANGQLAAARGYCEEAIAAAEETGSTWLLPQYWQLLGYVVLLEGQPDSAAVLYRKALIACRHHDPRLVGALIFHLALCGTSTGDYQRAAQIVGAYDALDAALAAAAPAKAYQKDPNSQMLQDDNRTQLLKAMGTEQFERAYVTGKSLSLEQACDLALGRTRPV
jgi:predicted ATPase/class 3 adenylate cyclase